MIKVTRMLSNWNGKDHKYEPITNEAYFNKDQLILITLEESDFSSMLETTPENVVTLHLIGDTRFQVTETLAEVIELLK